MSFSNDIIYNLKKYYVNIRVLEKKYKTLILLKYLLNFNTL